MKKKLIPILTAGILIVVVLLVLLLSKVIEKYTPSKEREDLTEYYSISGDDTVAIIWNDSVIDTKAKLIDGTVYLDIATIKEYLNDRFYWDASENKLLYTTANDLISVDAESSDYYVTKSKTSFSHTIVKVDTETAYVAVDFVKQYTDFTYSTFESPNRIVMTNKWGEYQTVTVKKDTELRHKGGIKSPILADTAKGTVLTLIEADETWSKVATEDGIIGYVKNKCLNDAETQTRNSEFVAENFTHLTRDFKINMGWHQVTNQAANAQVASVLSATKGINVLSPTWFYLNDNNGGIASLASTDYVNYCHQQGVEVWALVSNLEDDSVNTTEVLTHSSKRETLVNNLVSAAIQFNLDGINVDMESLDPAVGDSYIQFIRELSLKCDNNDIVLSVDNYVPTDYTAFYDRAEQAVFADYICIMAYDEHYKGSDEGPVASIGFVKDGVTNTLNEVPAEQIILGIPFYSRVWVETPTGEDSSEETDDGSYALFDLDSYATSMDEVQKLISANAATPSWSDVDGQNYVQYENGGSTYKIWIEDPTSIEEKLKVMNDNSLAGASFWKLTLENQSVWDTILKYM